MKNISDILAGWDKFLNPDSLKHNLLTGGLYLAAYEILKQSMMGRPREFFWSGFQDGKDIIGPDYQVKVLALDKHPYTASVLWWRQQGAIDDDDIKKFAEVREHRDVIAHDIPKILGTIDHSVRVDLLGTIYELLCKIDNWWIQNVEIPTNPDFDHQKFTDADLEGAASFSMVFLSMMLPIAAGDDSRLRSIYEAWSHEKAKQKG